MNICSDGHDEIVYDSKYCPFCVYIDDMKKEIKYLESEITSLTSVKESEG